LPMLSVMRRTSLMSGDRFPARGRGGFVGHPGGPSAQQTPSWLTLPKSSIMLTVMGDAVERLIWEVRRLFRAVAAAADETLEPLGITASDCALIEVLAREPRPVSLAELARKRSVSRQHIHQSLGRLRNPSWIEKTPDPDDARSVLLRLTDEGRSLWKEIRRVERTMLGPIGRQVDPWKVRAAAETLHEIRQVIEGEDRLRSAKASRSISRRKLPLG
jgi:DNA-binding MarR family transcriptional regulator